MSRFNTFLTKLASQERSSTKLAFSFCMGNYIAFSPFLGLHTVMVFLFVWLFRLNFTVTFAAAYLVNNIFTAVPVYAADYFFGYWFVHNVTQLDLQKLNNFLAKPLHILFLPFVSLWTFLAQYIPYSGNIVDSTSHFLETYVCFSKPCLWSFFIGGNLLGIVTSILLYPVIKKAFANLVLKIHDNNNEIVV